MGSGVLVIPLLGRLRRFLWPRAAVPRQPRDLSVYTMELAGLSGMPGSLRRLSTARRSWQPMIDGKGAAVVYWATEGDGTGHHLWLASVDGRENRQLTRGATVNGHPSWFPAGGRVAFFSTRDASGESEWLPSRQFDVHRAPASLYVLDVRTGECQRLTEGPFVDERPTVSPDGETVLFVSNRSGAMNLWRVRVDGTGLRQVTHGSPLDYRPTFSPAGDRFAYFAPAGDGSHQVVVRRWPEGALVDYDARPPFQWMHGPCFSGDGRQLLIHGLVRGDRLPRLWVLELENGKASPLSLPGVTECSHGTWDSTQGRIAFDSGEELV